ncbi:MAG: hypothetical protein QXP42_00120 [Candidatus Micrarchaeia archaeon]
MEYKKAQAAMEYLLVYSWAVLAIILVFGVMFYLGVFTPSPPRFCIFQQGFSCTAYKLDVDGNLLLKFAQVPHEQITITNVACTSRDIVLRDTVDFGSVRPECRITNTEWTGGLRGGLILRRGEEIIITSDGTKSGRKLKCCTTNFETGEERPVSGYLGQHYRGTIYIEYIDKDGNKRAAIGQISTTLDVP